MSTIDIRTESTGKVDKIVFADEDEDTSYVANCVRNREEENYIEVYSERERDHLRIRRGDIPNLIKALERALELGWGK